MPRYIGVERLHISEKLANWSLMEVSLLLVIGSAAILVGSRQTDCENAVRLGAEPG